MTISERHLEWLEGRRISVEVASHMGCYSAKRGSTGVEADPNGSILVFPYLENGEELNAKYRAPGKRFWQKQGGKKLLFNRDILADPSLQDGSHPLVFCEGEMDALALITAG